MEERRLMECEEERKREIQRIQARRNMGQEQIKQILEKQAERRRGLVRNYIEDRKMVCRDPPIYHLRQHILTFRSVPFLIWRMQYS